MRYQHLGDSEPKAKKPHRCYLCGLEIPVGTKYLRRAFVDEDGRSSVGMHLSCVTHTKDWTIDEWECHDSSEFREWLERSNANGEA